MCGGGALWGGTQAPDRGRSLLSAEAPELRRRRVGGQHSSEEGVLANWGLCLWEGVRSWFCGSGINRQEGSAEAFCCSLGAGGRLGWCGWKQKARGKPAGTQQVAASSCFLLQLWRLPWGPHLHSLTQSHLAKQKFGLLSLIPQCRGGFKWRNS